MFRSSIIIIRELYLYLSYIYVKTLGKITSFYIVLCAVHTTDMPLYYMLPHHLIYRTT